MPEGHTLHRLALEVEHFFRDRTVAASSPQGRFAESAALLDGSMLTAADAHGKQLFVGFADEQWLHIHLGLIGSLIFAPPAPPQGEVRLRLATSEIAADLRGPQTCALVTAEQLTAIVAALGPDPLRSDADQDLAWRRIHRSARPIAALLMDQTIVSGIGNVYRAEVLFRNRIDPFRPGKLLFRKSWLAIWSDLVALMPIGVRDGRIDTVHTAHTPEAMQRAPRVDDHGGEVYVYRRTGQPCYVCGSRIRTEAIAGRNLFWCGKCQRRG